ncbi:unnamed protein product [Hymenolepis diminuta]|uniref:Protein krueppel n=1 Tax=Hymenolepis diminuta TaxID=6216 RepID=A0A0R3SHJ0_HYMDI|nr:unnamed protein product [Hymenolepis diminuta]VUZ47149.1 unnamed protein product [Hymenolepis diminuta]
MELPSVILNNFLLELQGIQLKSAIREAIANSLHVSDNSNLFVEGRLIIEVPEDLTSITLSFTNGENSETRSQSSRSPLQCKSYHPFKCIEQQSTNCSDNLQNTNKISRSKSASSTSMIDYALDLTKGASVPTSLQETLVKEDSVPANEMMRLFQQNLFSSTCRPLFQLTTTLPTMSSAIQLESHSVTPSPKKRRRLEVTSVRKTDEFRQFRCNQCDDIFNSLRNLESHTQETHGGYKCHLCKMPFTQRSNLQRHALKHVDFKPFECNLCEKAYYRKDHLMRHMQKAHPFQPVEENIRVKLRTSESLDYLRQTREEDFTANINSGDGNSINESLNMKHTLDSEDGELAVMKRVMKADTDAIESPV